MTIDDDFLIALGPFDPSWRGLLPTSRDNLARCLAIDDENAALVNDGDDVRFWPQTFNTHREIGDLLARLLQRIEGEDARAAAEIAKLPRTKPAEIASAERFLAAQSARRAEWFAALREAFGGSTIDGDALRADILIAVESGDMRPSFAEHVAELLCWPRFADWADRTRFDPIADDVWTLAMVAAWARWRESDRARTVEQVRHCWPAYLAASTRWVERGAGHVLGPREDRGWSDLPGESSDTKRSLVEALRDGRVKASCWRSGKRAPIGKAEWCDLLITGFHDCAGVHHVITPDGDEVREIRIRRDDALSAFPLSDENDVETLRPISKAQAKLLLSEEAKARSGNILGQNAAVRFLKGRGYSGRDNIRAAVTELTGGRKPGKR